MFLLRCAFWLGVGFVAVKPFAMDATTAAIAADEIYAQGHKVIVEQASAVQCNDIACTIAKSATIATLQNNSSLDASNQISKLVAAPTPPVRPLWAG